MDLVPKRKSIEAAAISKEGRRERPGGNGLSHWCKQCVLLDVVCDVSRMYLQTISLEVQGNGYQGGGGSDNVTVSGGSSQTQ